MNYLTILGDQAHTSGANGTITRVVIHATVSPCVPGGARGNARYFQQPDAGGLAHYVVDPSEVVQCCDESVCAWQAPPNKGSIGVELCDPQTGNASRWTDQPHTQMLTRAAALVADICTRHNLPLTYVDRAGLLAGNHGITTHFEVAQAWHQSDHTDPGPGFPIDHFISLVRAAAGASTTAPEVPVTDAEIEKVAQRAAALIRQDLAVLLHGTRDGSHPANLDAIWNAVKK